MRSATPACSCRRRSPACQSGFSWDGAVHHAASPARRLLHRHEARQGLDAGEPGAHVGIVRQRDISFGRVGDVGVAGHVGDRRQAAHQERRLVELRVHDLQQRVRPRDHFVGVVLAAEDRDEACRGGAEGDLPGGDRQPALDHRFAGRVSRQPGVTAVAARQVDQDGVGVGDDRAVVVQHRHLAERVQPEEVGLLVGALPEVHLDQFNGQPEQGQQQFGPVGVAGEGKAVELERGERGWRTWGLLRCLEGSGWLGPTLNPAPGDWNTRQMKDTVTLNGTIWTGCTS